MKIINPATQEVIADVPADSPGGRGPQGRPGAQRPAGPGRAPRWTSGWGPSAASRTPLAARKDDAGPDADRRDGQAHHPGAQRARRPWPAGIDFFLNETAAVLSEDVVLREGDAARPALTETIRHEPLGVVANMSAWNYPYFVGSNVFVPALLTGNTVLYKPSELATLTGPAHRRAAARGGRARRTRSSRWWAAATWARRWWPSRSTACSSPAATPPARRSPQAVAGRLVKLQLELGGKDPTYVCDDVDVKAAAEGLADGAFYNTGQSCCSVERIYVHQTMAPAFIEAFVETVRGFKVGDPEDERRTSARWRAPAQLDGAGGAGRATR